MAGQLDTFRTGAMKDLYLFLECGVFQESTEGKIGQDTHGWACPHLAEVVYFQDLLFLSLGSSGTSQISFFLQDWLTSDTSSRSYLSLRAEMLQSSSS